MPRRGESIYKRSDGRWEARYISHYDNGKAKYKFVYAKTYSEVKAKRLEEQKKVLPINLNKVKSTITFEALASMWLEEIKSNVKESTYARYYRVTERILIPRIGKNQLNKLDISVFKSIYAELLESGGKNGKPLSSKSVSDIFSIIKSIYKYGRLNGYPCADLSLITQSAKSKKSVSILSKNSFNILQKNLLLSNDRVSLGILFTLYTGVRIGELCGIKQDDIDLCEGLVRISRTVERIANLDPQIKGKTKIVISTPKTENSYRVIPLPLFLINYIQKFQTKGNNYILTGTDKPTEPHQFYLRYKTYLRKCGIENYTFHALRHTFATNCIEHGFDPKSLSEILGHSDISTTLAIYVHPTLSQKRELMERLTPQKSS